MPRTFRWVPPLHALCHRRISVNKGLSEKLNSEEKEKIMDALKDGQSWLDSNPEADAEEIIAAQGNSIRAFLKPWEDIAVYVSPGREIPFGTWVGHPISTPDSRQILRMLALQSRTWGRRRNLKVSNPAKHRFDSGRLRAIYIFVTNQFWWVKN